MTIESLNGTGIVLRRFYKVPYAQELPYAGRWLKAIGHYAGSVHFREAGGKTVSFYNSAAERLARTATDVRVITPASWR